MCVCVGGESVGGESAGGEKVDGKRDGYKIL